MSMPFGLIFSIILIVIFVIIAFIAVKHFLDIGDCARVGKFYDGFQQKVDEAWRSQTYGSTYTISLPSGVRVCFANLSLGNRNSDDAWNNLEIYSVNDANTFMYPAEKSCNMAYKKINHIDISNITAIKNPYCFDSSIKLKKDIYDKLVTIS